MAEETQYTANTGLVSISTANSNLDGTGTLGDIITGASNGTLIKSVTIKAQVSTTQGMVRLYIKGGGNTRLLDEVEVPALTKSSYAPSFEKRIEMNLQLKSGYILQASTQNAEAFNVIAEGLDWAYYASSVRTDTTQFTSSETRTTVSTANSNLDGTGTLATLIQAGAAASWNGLKVNSIIIKATGNTTPGMIRLFIQNSGSTLTKLTAEIPVPAVTRSATTESFFYRIDYGDKGLDIQPDYKILVSTQNAETFIVTIDAMDWKYLP